MSTRSDAEVEQLIAQAQELLARFGTCDETDLPLVKQSLLPLIQKLVTRAQQCFRQGELDLSLKLNKVVLASSRILESRGGEAVTIYNMGLLYKEMKRSKAALDCFLQAREIEREQGDTKSEASSLKQIAELYLKLGQPEAALEHLQQLLAIQEKLVDKAGKAATQEIIDMIHEEMGK